MLSRTSEEDRRVRQMMNLKKKAALAGAVLLLSLSMATSVFAETGTVTANVKLRSAPSTDAELVSGVDSGSTVEITGEENGWYKVTVNGMAGYISSEYVTKGAASTSQTTSTEATETSAAESTAATGSESDATVTVNGNNYQISQNFLETSIPSGFSSGTVTINGVGYKGAVSEAMGISLVYLYNDSDEGFFVYEEATSSFKKFVKVGSDSSFIILNSLPDGFEAPSGYSSTALSNDPSGTISGLVKDDADASDLYYVYATNNEGNTGWYIYDSQLGSYIRASQPQAAATATTGSETDDLAAVSSDASGSSDDRIQTYTHLLAILIGAIVLLLIIIVNLLLWYRRGYKEELQDLEEDGYFDQKPGRRSRSYEEEYDDFDEDEEEEDEDEEEEDDFEEEEVELPPRRKSESRPRSKAQSKSEPKAQAKAQPKKSAPKKKESKAELLEHDDDLDMDFLDLNDL